MPSAKDFLSSFIPVVRQLLKKVTRTGFHTTTSATSHYQVPDCTAPFAAIDPAIPKIRRAKVQGDDARRMLALGSLLGSIRQQRPRARTKPKAGSLPPYVYLLATQRENEEVVRSVNEPVDAVGPRCPPREIQMQKGQIVVFDRDFYDDAVWRARNHLPVCLGVVAATMRVRDEFCSVQMCTQRPGNVCVHETTMVFVNVPASRVEAVRADERGLWFDAAEDAVKMTSSVADAMMAPVPEDVGGEYVVEDSDEASVDDEPPRRSGRVRRRPERFLS
jgi:hypothetical protein